MKIVGRLLISLAGAVVAAGVTLVGCGTTNNINSGGGTSALGESCSRTFDCAAHLACVENVCLPEAVTVDGGSADGGEGGITTGPHLGLLGESCQTSRDCQSPYACVGEVCSNDNYDLTATGKTCTGECNTPTDCCELPVGFSASLYNYNSPDGGANNRTLLASSLRCEDLLAYLGGDTSACSTPLSYNFQYYLAEGCAIYQQYCQCATNTWACNNNQCAYTAPCTVPTATAVTAATCPTETRTGRPLGPTCNVAGGGAGNGTCSAGCSVDTDCDGKQPNGAGHTCSGSDAGPTNCTCYQSACYFACKADIDCTSGSTCDATTHLCKATGCTTNSDCVLSTKNAQAQCVAGACQTACQSDIECMPKSNPPTYCLGGFCKAAGCSSDTDCAGVGGAHEFCVTAPASTATTYSSAITN